MLVGYMRVSSADDRQSVDLQRDALITAGIDDASSGQNRRLARYATKEGDGGR